MRIKSENFFEEPHLTVTGYNTNIIPSERGYMMALSLRSKKFPIYEVVAQKEQFTKEVESICPIRINDCNLKLRVGATDTVITMSNDDRSWTSGYNTSFYKVISKEDIEFLTRMVKRNTLSYTLEVRGLGIVQKEALDFEIWLKEGKLGGDEFEKIFLENTGLQYSYLREFNLSTPVIENLSSKPALYELYDYVSSLQNNLEQALRTLRLTNDYAEVMALIRTPLDGFKLLKNKTTLLDDLAKEMYVDESVLVDLHGTGGAQMAAREIVDQLFAIFDVLFDISSKALHSKTRYSPPQQFQMFPGYCEAEFSLTLALSISNYILDRIKLSLTN